MIKILKGNIILFLLLLSLPSLVYSTDPGSISGIMILDDSWDRHIYLSFIKTFEKEYSISNDLIIASSEIDSIGNFHIGLKQVPTKWSLLRLHVVKKGISPNSLVIGSQEENFFFIVAKQDSEIRLKNSTDKPIFKSAILDGASHMKTFDYIRKLSSYPNSIDYENSIIEKEFIMDVVAEKLKVVADTCQNPLVSLYALYQTDFQSDYHQVPEYYDKYLDKWQAQNSTYFDSFKLKFPNGQDSNTSVYKFPKFILLLILFGIISLTGFYFLNRRGSKIETLSIQERRIFNLLRKGLSNKEISAECNIGLSTVKSHVGNIYSKLHIKSRREAINLKVK